MENKGKYYLTTAIAYTSAKPHIGNNYEIVLADSIARFKRKEGYDVFFQTGTDEHGQKIELKAEAAGITPKEHVDKIAGVIRGLCDLLNISYDKFIRTTDALQLLLANQPAGHTELRHKRQGHLRVGGALVLL